MCDQTEVSYLENDVVWVKIGPIWWPGVVKDLERDEEGREILKGFKKKPIAVVKFFQEDNYEFVKNLEQIYHYSCRRKDEFIKKGLDKFRTGASHMKKFPSDVTTAESLTNGDVNIINDPKFLPEKKESYSEIFGSGKKKTKKESDVTPKSKVRTSANVTPYRPITHQRFINKVLHGESDHKVKTLIQCNSGSDDGPERNQYRCHICKFETSRLNVIVAHHRLLHSSKNSITWTGSDSKLIKRKPVYKSRKIKSRKLFNISKDDLSDDDEDDEILEKKKPPKSKTPKEKTKAHEKIKNEENLASPPKRKNKEDTIETGDFKKPRFTDVLLADWNVEEEEDKKEEVAHDKEENKDDNSENEKEKSKDEGEGEVENSEHKSENLITSPDLLENSDSPSRKNQSEKMSCFDFEDEEEGFIGMSNANTYGRKIPRVIPVKDKTELGMDLEIEQLFKKKNNDDSEASQENSEKAEEIEDSKPASADETNEVSDNDKETENPAPTLTKRRRSKHSKDEDVKTNPEDSLALRRTRRPGAKKSYLNEVIEKIDDDDSQQEMNEKIEQEKMEIASDDVSPKPEASKMKEETGSSSRRKQDFRQHTMESDKEEIIYSDNAGNEQKFKTSDFSEPKKPKSRGRKTSDDLTAQIDNLLEETKLPSLPGISQDPTDTTQTTGKCDDSIKSNTNLFSFDYITNESAVKKTNKNKTEIKSISRMFSDSIPGSEESSDILGDTQAAGDTEHTKESAEENNAADNDQGKSGFVTNVTSGNSSQKRGSILLSSMPKTTEGQVKVLPVVRQGNSSKDCIVLPAGKKFDVKKSATEDGDDNSTEAETSSRPKNIKAIKVKSDSLPSSLISSGKIKGQTIIHQKGGKYVIVTQPPQAGRPRTTSGKVQSGSKVVILTNQLGEQKIITTSGLQQSKFKVEGQKITSPEVAEKEAASTASTSGSSGQSQPVIKMVPDGKGGIMKQVTVSPKKVLLGGTKVLVSGSGSTFSSGNNVQKIALSSGGSVARTGSGDFRLIENYKGSGKTVLIQGSSNASSGVVLKSSSVMPRQVTKVIQNIHNIPSLKKKPKILMRASTGQGEYVVQSASGTIESPTFVVKQKAGDGKFSTQKIVRTEIVNTPKISSSGTSTKTFFVSGQGSNKKGESYIITTNESAPSKVIRMRQKIKEVDASASKTAQKIVHKSNEVFSIPQNSLLLPNQISENETSQIVQIQEQAQQPVLQTQVIAMPGPVGADGNQTYVLVSVDENGVVQGMDNSVVAYDATAQPDQIFVNPTSTNNVILINPQASEEVAPVFSTSSQDILAEALANTNVLEGSINNEMETVVPSILLPPSIPSSVVQETSITLQKPIMTPLEMPSSVAPDTSGLEPPPLPPTPTEEDVLMEESEMPPEEGEANQENPIQNEKKEKETTSINTLQTYLEPGNFDTAESAFQVTNFQKDENQKIFGAQFDNSNGGANSKESEVYQPGEPNENKALEPEEFNKNEPREDFIAENSREEQNTNSFQSMPILNDEPDTSDDAQGSDHISDQNFDLDKSRVESEQFSQILREQEPPSSTNNEILTESNHQAVFDSGKYGSYQSYECENQENDTKSKETDKEVSEEQSADQGDQKDKEQLGGHKEILSIPLTADESNASAYESETGYLDVASQKRLQEETEVSSTTDEFASKDIST